MKEVDKFGIGNVVALALNRIDPGKNKSIHVSFDIDSLDPLEAPSTGTPGTNKIFILISLSDLSRTLKCLQLEED